MGAILPDRTFRPDITTLVRRQVAVSQLLNSDEPVSYLTVY